MPVESIPQLVKEEEEFDSNELMGNVPKQWQNWTLEHLAENRLELEHFRRFLDEKNSALDLTCWMEIEALRRYLEFLNVCTLSCRMLGRKHAFLNEHIRDCRKNFKDVDYGF